MHTQQLLGQNVLTLLGLEGLSEEKKFAFLQQASELIEKRIVVRIIEVLPDTEKSAFMDAIAQKDTSGIATILSQHVSSLDAVVEEEVSRMKAELKEVVAKLEV